MAKYKTTSQPATYALHKLMWARQGVVAQDFIGPGPLVLDTAQWIAGGRPTANAIFNLRGEVATGYPVMRVLSVGAGAPFVTGDFAAVIWSTKPSGPMTGNQDLLPLFGIDPAAWPGYEGGVACLKVIPIDDNGNPIATGGTGTGGTNTSTPTDTTTGYPTYSNTNATGFPVGVRPLLDPSLLLYLAQTSDKATEREIARQERLARQDALDAQLAAERERRAWEAEEDRRRERREERERRRLEAQARQPYPRAFNPDYDLR